MPAMLSPALEALMRLEGRAGTIPTEQDVGMLGMPVGMPMSNQAPYQQRRNVPDGSLGALSQLIAGLGGPMPGYDQPVQPEQRTFVIRPQFSPGEFVNNAGAPEPYRHVGGIAPSSEAGALVAELERQAGGQQIDPMLFRQPGKDGIVDPAKHAAWKQGMAADEQARRDVVTNRAMQVAQARTNRQSGMDPRTAALLSALGGEEGGLGAMLLADTVLGKGSAIKLREQDDNRAIGMAAVDAKREKNAATAAPGGDVTKSTGDAVTGAIASGDKTAVQTALNSDARLIVSGVRKRGLPFKETVDESIRQLRQKHGVSAQEAADAVAVAMDMQPGAFPGREGKAPPGPIDKGMDAVGGFLENFIKTGMF